MRGHIGWCVVITVVASAFVAGCTSYSTKQVYEFPGRHVRIEKPAHWQTAVHERSGTMMLEARHGFGVKESVRIDISRLHGSTCDGAKQTNSRGAPLEGVKDLLRNRQELYAPYVISVVETPREVTSQHYKIAKAIIDVPTQAFEKDSIYNKQGAQTLGTFQPVELFEIKSEELSIQVMIYKGQNNTINAEADEIVKSIQLVCN
jgi:hypothetical protein